MKEKQSKHRRNSYLLYFILACALVLGVTFARYKSEVSGKATGTVAKVALNSTVDLSSGLKNMKPGESRGIDVSVSNQKEDGTVSDVTQDYTITVRTTGNLPLEFTLAPKNKNGDGTYVSDNPAPGSGGNPTVWPDGQMPHSKPVRHEYTLTVKWKDGATDAKYADEIDKITLEVDASQTQK